MAIDMYSSRTMLEALKVLKRPTKFLLDTFFTNVRTFETAAVDIDTVFGKRRTACYVKKTLPGTAVSSDGMTTTSYTPPYIKHFIPTTAFDMLNRSAGEGVYGLKSPAERVAEKLANDLMVLDDMITRAEELQAAQALFTGTVTLTHENGQTDVVTFGQDATHLLTSHSLPWSGATGVPLDDLRAWKRMLLKDGGVNPNTVIMGRDALNAFITNAQVLDGKGAISSVRVDRGQINPTSMPDGVTYIGFLPEIGCEIYAYDAWYVAGNGSAEVELIPSNYIWMGSTNARMDRLYGPIMEVDATYAVPRFPKTWVEQNPSARMLMLQSSPLLVPVELGTFMSAYVCAAT